MQAKVFKTVKLLRFALAGGGGEPGFYEGMVRPPGTPLSLFLSLATDGFLSLFLYYIIYIYIYIYI